MILSLATIGIFLSVILLYFNAKKFTSSIYLGIFFFGVSLYGFYQYVLVYSKSVLLVGVILFSIPFLSSLIYLIGPMLYWFVRAVLTDKPGLKRSDIWHFLPMIVFIIAALPNLFTAWSVKMEAATNIVNNAGAMQQYKPTVLSGIFSYPVMFLSRPVLVLCYTFWSTGLFFRYLLKKGEQSVLLQQQFMTKWLCVLLGSISIFVISHILIVIDFTVKDSNVFFTLTSLQILSSVGLTVLLISPFFFPTILYGLPRYPEPKVIPENLTKESLLLTTEVSKKPSRFESDYLLLIQQKTESCMHEFQPYLQPECNLAQFSVLIQIPVHHLAYYFREIKKQSFIDFRNHWRVEHAKNLIREGKLSGMTLEAIGLLSGFSSRNTFLNAFKKIEGISPNDFVTRIEK